MLALGLFNLARPREIVSLIKLCYFANLFSVGQVVDVFVRIITYRGWWAVEASCVFEYNFHCVPFQRKERICTISFKGERFSYWNSVAKFSTYLLLHKTFYSGPL